MPLNIIRQDITKTRCDVIVNATNRHMTCDFGVSAAIFEAAGNKLADCLQGSIEIGEVRVTPAFNLPCKNIFHVAGPIWRGGGYLEFELLALCYKNVLKKASELGFTSIAIPLISSGSRGFPKEYVLKIAVETIAEYLYDEELDVYLVVYDKNSYSIGKELFGDITEYINDNYVDEEEYTRPWRRYGNYLIIREPIVPEPAPQNEKSNEPISPPAGDKHSKTEDKVPIERKQAQPAPPVDDEKSSRADGERKTPRAIQAAPPTTPIRHISDHISEIEKILRQTDDSFADTLFKLIDARGMTDLDCYKKANVSRQTWHKIISDENYKPSKTTAIAFAIALRLNLKETKHLLETVGFALSKSNKFDLIIEYCITHGVYDVLEINNALFEFDQTLLGV